MSETVQHTITLTIEVDVLKWAQDHGIQTSAKEVAEDVAAYYDLSSVSDALIPDYLRRSVTAVRQ